MWSSDTAEIALDDVIVPNEHLIGLEPGRGFAQLMWQLQYERISGAAACLGYADARPRRDHRVRDASVTRSEGRSAGHQVVAHKLADAATELAAARALVYDTVVAALAGRVPRRRDLDGEEVLRAGVQPPRRRLPPGATAARATCRSHE